jgi:hypothetical protein
MNALQANKISKDSLVDVIEKEYQSIIKRIEHAAKLGETDIYLDYNMPSNAIVKRLENEGYWFYSCGGGDPFGAFPKYYGISWEAQKPKKKWFSRKKLSRVGAK